MSEIKKSGVVTAASRFFFPGLQLLARSIGDIDESARVACFDLGFTNEQLQYAKQALHNVDIINVPSNPEFEFIRAHLTAPTKRGRDEWRIWACPFFIEKSPFQQTVWMDCDTIVLRNIQVLFAMLEDGPVFTASDPLDIGMTGNMPKLYELMPVDNVLSDEPHINAGVIGIDLTRDIDLLNSYKMLVLRAAEDPNLKSMISWYDQGALIWAILKCSLCHRIADTSWNRSVASLGAEAVSRLEKFQVSDDLFESIRLAFPGINILHWYGMSNKLWHTLSRKPYPHTQDIFDWA